MVLWNIDWNTVRIMLKTDVRTANIFILYSGARWIIYSSVISERLVEIFHVRISVCFVFAVQCTSTSTPLLSSLL